MSVKKRDEIIDLVKHCYGYSTKECLINFLLTDENYNDESVKQEYEQVLDDLLKKGVLVEDSLGILFVRHTPRQFEEKLKNITDENHSNNPSTNKCNNCKHYKEVFDSYQLGQTWGICLNEESLQSGKVVFSSWGCINWGDFYE